ncbi:MAG: hypothetical protein F2667_10615 [Actinobacteria bacterium]|uniref:Unannotated protein n=1 Tax=freshwater metagenome TaxID=449393 RepID=A0A6J6RCY8_9ZZZZ|nr:hypothetical protein [Actinomycetota bacterium]
MPISISGLSADRVAQLRQLDHTWSLGGMLASARTTGTAQAADAGSADIVAGGNLAASLSYGDISFAGVGTATTVCDGKVVGFGHPFQFLGATSLGLHPADAVYVQPDSLGAPFKLANIAPVVGSITQDRRTGLTGVFGTLPDVSTVTSTVTYGARERTGSTDVYFERALPDIGFSQLFANHDRVLDAAIPGSDDTSWTITGTDGDGEAFTISYADSYVSDYDIAYESAGDLANTLYALSQLEDVSVTSVVADSAVDDDHDPYRITGLQQQVRGKWVTVKTARVDAGDRLVLRAVLTNEAGTTYAPYSVQIPRGARSGQLQVTGGQRDYFYLRKVTSVADVQKGLAGAVRNDEVSFELRLAGKGVKRQQRTDVGPLDTVVDGSKRLTVVVR